jgi:Fe2+ or Zn2+ uptake regulation protein
VEIIDSCVAEDLTKLVAAKGYTDISHSLEFFGICRTCRK